ncbi:MAG: hypothetical protein R1F54_04575 [Candidatus Zeuxoniibacter abyssi]|nr:MAG: hypothetical protein R1F54_04575 [Candidatus Persebacteraceae bacterium AB1(2)]
MLIKGKWTTDWTPVQAKDEKGRFQRQELVFRKSIGDEVFPAETGRYRLYVAYICPWASRTLALRNLKGLQNIIPITVTEPIMTDYGWRFGDYPGATAPIRSWAPVIYMRFTLTRRRTIPAAQPCRFFGIQKSKRLLTTNLPKL